LEKAWGKIDHCTEQGKTVLTISKDIKTEFGDFYEKVDISSNLTDEDHRRYVFSLFADIMKKMKNIVQDAQLPQRNSGSAADVYLNWLTDRAMHRTQNRRSATRL